MKPGPANRHAVTDLSNEALDWLIRLNSGSETNADKAAFEEWRRRSLQHAMAADDAEALWHGLGAAGAKVRGTERRKKNTRRAVLGGTFALAGAIALERIGAFGPSLLADHVTAIGEQRFVELADGSSVLLNTDTALSVDFGAAERRLRLFHGAAMFEVAPDVSRPFSVEAEGGRTQAVGTAFTVDIRQNDVVVTVVEGTVAISSGEPPHRVVAEADSRVLYTASRAPSSPEPVNADTETAWRRGKLIFDNRPLGEVVAEVERYRGGRTIVIGDGLRALEVSGVFELSDPDSVLTTIESTLPVRVTRLPYLTVIR